MRSIRTSTALLCMFCFVMIYADVSMATEQVSLTRLQQTVALDATQWLEMLNPMLEMLNDLVVQLSELTAAMTKLFDELPSVIGKALKT